MCGICGFYGTGGFSNSRGAQAQKHILSSMIDSLGHRGPDGEGMHIEDPIALGHARLAVIDLTTGAQPLSNEDGRYWVTYNGEIFNYLELREELLAKSHRFRTESDTEVLVHGYEEYGVDFFQRLNGQWAAAIWDARREELLLCRDRVGICPLFYTRVGKKVLFASEVKALFRDPEVPREMDLRGLMETFTFWTAVPPQTVFRGISELPPGRWVRFGRETVEEGSYYDFNFPAYNREEGGAGTAEQYAEELRGVLREATRLRFTRSDVPVAAYLSGGIDSSVTAGVIRQFTDTELKTFSLRFSDNEFDEGGYQEQMVQRLGTDHEAITVGYRDIGEIFPEVVRHTENPILRTAPAPMFLLSRLVRDSGYKVVVTGEGSDEMLGGYDIYREAVVRSFIARDPDSPERGEIIRHLYPWLQRNPTAMPAMARSFFSQSLDGNDFALSHRPRWQSASGLSRLLSEDARSEISKYNVADDFVGRMPAEAGNWHALSRAQWLEVKSLLAGYLLASQGDRMLMANGVEGRFPFLDPNLIDWAAKLPPRYKIMGLDEKYILKHAFRDMLPEEILKRPKQPYRAPDAASFFGSSPEWLDEITSPESLKASGIFNPAAVGLLVAKCRKRNGRGMSNFDNMAVTAVLSTLLLQREFGLG